jgi:hypothetical protein
VGREDREEDFMGRYYEQRPRRGSVREAGARQAVRAESEGRAGDKPAETVMEVNLSWMRMQTLLYRFLNISFYRKSHSREAEQHTRVTGKQVRSPDSRPVLLPQQVRKG